MRCGCFEFEWGAHSRGGGGMRVICLQPRWKRRTVLQEATSDDVLPTPTERVYNLRTLSSCILYHPARRRMAGSAWSAAEA